MYTHMARLTWRKSATQKLVTRPVFPDEATEPRYTLYTSLTDATPSERRRLWKDVSLFETARRKGRTARKSRDGDFPRVTRIRDRMPRISGDVSRWCETSRH